LFGTTSCVVTSIAWRSTLFAMHGVAGQKIWSPFVPSADAGIDTNTRPASAVVTIVHAATRRRRLVPDVRPDEARMTDSQLVIGCSPGQECELEESDSIGHRGDEQWPRMPHSHRIDSPGRRVSPGSAADSER
jgi:hypothetical protein